MITDSALRATTFDVDLPQDAGLANLLPHLRPSGVWLREGHGMIGLGTAASAAANGPQRFKELAHWWAALDLNRSPSASAQEFNGHKIPGSGPLAFTTITYSAESEHSSAVVVPQLVLGSTEAGSWITAVSDAHTRVDDLLSAHGLTLQGSQVALLNPNESPQPVPPTHRRPGSQSERHYLQAVAAGLSAIDEGAAEKLVLARDVVVDAEAPLPLGPLLTRLTDQYSDCWTYLVADVLGATPEMLVRLRGQEVFSRVLAGTVDHDAVDPEHAHSGLLGDHKQHREHELAVRSLLEQLEPVVETLTPSAEPRVLELPNVYHLATDITGQLAHREDGARPSPLSVAEHAHPTAAVCGTPTQQADQLLGALEGLDRGPFAGPVGWMDSQGNADFGIALRGGVLENEATVRLYAGCGVVAGSEPEAELAETHAKLRVMLTALGA